MRSVKGLSRMHHNHSVSAKGDGIFTEFHFFDPGITGGIGPDPSSQDAGPLAVDYKDGGVWAGGQYGVKQGNTLVACPSMQIKDIVELPGVLGAFSRPERFRSPYCFPESSHNDIKL